jgi:hypothetical protein
MSAMTDQDPTVLALLEKQISTLERNLNGRLDTTERNLNGRLDRQDKALEEIKTQTTKTNGRVSVLERARERGLGVVMAFKWVPPILAAAVTAGLTILTLAITGQIH